MATLLSYNGVQDISDAEGRTALMWAAQKGNASCIRAMLEMGTIDLHVRDQLGATGECTCVYVMVVYMGVYMHV